VEPEAAREQRKFVVSKLLDIQFTPVECVVLVMGFI